MGQRKGRIGTDGHAVSCFAYKQVTLTLTLYREERGSEDQLYYVSAWKKTGIPTLASDCV
jgi:hypothetical protein